MARSTGQSILEIELHRLQNAIQHLEASNAELSQLIQADRAAGRPIDPDYKLAFEENIVTLAKQKARLEAMEKELQRTATLHSTATDGSQGPGGGTTSRHDSGVASEALQDHQEVVTSAHGTGDMSIDDGASELMSVPGGTAAAGREAGQDQGCDAERQSAVHDVDMETSTVERSTLPHDHPAAPRTNNTSEGTWL